MKGRGGKNIGPSLDWLREVREQAERGGGGGGSGGKGGSKGKYAPDWECGECGNTNFARRTECFKCGAVRGSCEDETAGKKSSWADEKYRGGGDSGGWKNWRDQGKEEDASGDWECSKCWASNWAKRSECFKCGASRPANTVENKAKSKPPSGGKGAGGGGGGKKQEEDNPESSRNLVKDLYDFTGDGRKTKRSHSGSSGSSSGSARRKKLRKRTGLWDSTQQVAEAKPAAAPAKKKSNAGLVLEVGAKVDIHGLVGAAQYNGHEGHIAAGPNEKGRWLVQVLFEGDVKEIAMQPSNLEPKPTCGWELVVAGLSNLSTERDVSDVFAQFGKVHNTRVTRDLNGESKCVALVVMASKEGAENALSRSSESDIRVGGRPTSLQWSTMVKQQMGLLKNRDEEMGQTNDGCEGTATGSRKFQEQSASMSKSGPFDIGQSVNVSGLKSAPQYNGTIGVVQGFRPDGRCEVLLHANGESKTLALKVDNLSIASGAADMGNARQENHVDSAGEGSRSRRFQDVPKAPSNTPSAAAETMSNAHHEVGEPGEPQKRRRSTLWDDGQQTGEVYVGAGKASDAESSRSRETKDADVGVVPLPDEAAIGQMSAKELKKLLVAHKVDISGCFEKSEFLEKALTLIRSAQSRGVGTPENATSVPSAGDVDPMNAVPSQVSEPVEPRKRRRASLWDEGQQAGEVYVGAGRNTSAESSKGVATTEAGEGLVEPLPDESTMSQMSAKDLKKLLTSHKVDISGCFEKAEFLEKALTLTKMVSS